MIDPRVWALLSRTTDGHGVEVSLYQARHGRRMVVTPSIRHLYAEGEWRAAAAMYARLAGRGVATEGRAAA